MKQRSGVTLTEVLVAIFVMGVGLLSLLVLFPLGALNMAQSVKDDRAAHCSDNAWAIANMWNVYYDPSVVYQPSGAGPSFPVYVDPVGFSLGSTNVGGQASFSRVEPTFTTTQATIDRWFTLLDDMEFAENSNADLNSGSIQRSNRYSWAYLLRQVQYKAAPPPAPLGVDITIVVYDRRPHLAAPGGALVGETSCQATFTSGSDLAQLTFAGIPPPLRKGSWLLDATATQGVSHGYFYRILNVNQSAGSTMQVELDQKARASTQPNAGVGVVMENIAEVFQKPTHK